MSSLPPVRVRCRQIAEGDLDAITDLLTAGFPARSRKYWTSAIATLSARPQFEGCPRFGYMLESDGAPVGVVLLIFTAVGTGSAPIIRCNPSSWYVAPQARTYGSLLASQALKLKHITYLNVSPAPHTMRLLDAQGYQRYSDGQMFCLPALGRKARGAVVRRVGAGDDGAALKALPEYDLLVAHAAAGCISLVCEIDDEAHPFVLLPRRMGQSFPGLTQLAWCRDTADFVLCAGALGRFLLPRGVLAVACDADGPIAGLVGRFFKGKSPKYFKGADRPRLNDLAFTEAVLFGA
jgi:hypothetical protein